MEDRAYLSIGEVLALLKEEFPDVTISKIRFLESQGLLDPERTPSGYRKFYDTDVERLRWILRQQREHFLPLKVIKGRLRGGAEPVDETPPVVVDPEPVEPVEPEPVEVVDAVLEAEPADLSRLPPHLRRLGGPSRPLEAHRRPRPGRPAMPTIPEARAADLAVGRCAA